MTILAAVCAALGLIARRRHARAGAAELHAQVQPRARAEGALSRRLPELGQARSRSAPRAGSRSRSSTARSSAREEDIIEQIRQGANIGQNTDSARMGNYVPGIAVMNGPYFAETLEDVAKLRKAPTVIKWQEELADQVRPQGRLASTGCRAIATSSPTSRSRRRTTSRACASARRRRRSGRNRSARSAPTPVAMAFGEMYPGLQQQAIDGVELVYNNIPGGRFYEVLKYANETKHIMLINFEVVSAKWFDGLPKEYQDVADRGMRQGRRGDLEADLQARSRGRAAAQGPRHDDREGRRSRRLPQGRRQGLRGARRSPTPRTPCTRRSARTRPAPQAAQMQKLYAAASARRRRRSPPRSWS